MTKNAIENLIEGCLGQVLTEIAHSYPEELNVYDFDDTLVKTDGSIYLVNNNTGGRRAISSHEFHEYDLQPHEEYDVSDFDADELINPTTLPHLAKMKADYQRLGPHGVSICTARPDAGPVIDFMGKHGMADIEIVAVGDPVPRGSVGDINPARKKAYLKNKILQRDLRILRFYDDDESNVQAAQTLVDTFPNVTIEVEHVG